MPIATAEPTVSRATRRNDARGVSSPYQPTPTTTRTASSTVSAEPTALRHGSRRIISPQDTVPTTSPEQYPRTARRFSRPCHQSP